MSAGLNSAGHVAGALPHDGPPFAGLALAGHGIKGLVSVNDSHFYVTFEKESGIVTAKLSAIVMAAGKGTRMRSDLPKPLHPAAGRSMLHWVIEALRGCETDHHVIVVGHGADQVVRHVQAAVPDVATEFVEQMTQRGTGDAASVGVTGLPEDPDDRNDVIILPGDTPLLNPSTLAAFVEYHRSSGSVCTLLSAVLDDATGYGRVVRGRDGSVERVVEQRDATPEELAIQEWNTSIYCFKQNLLAPALRRITPDNAQGEYYLTDVIEVLRDTGHQVHAFTTENATEVMGVNDRAQLAEVATHLRRRINDGWMHHGVALVDPAATYIDASVTIGDNVTLLPGTGLYGSTVIGDGAVIGPHTTLTDCVVGAGASLPHVVGTGAGVADGAAVAPFSVLVKQ